MTTTDTAARFDELIRHDGLIRLGNTTLDDCLLVHHAKLLYEELHPETRHGACGGRGAHRRPTSSLSFSNYLAEHVGCSVRSVERAVRIAARIAPQLVARIRKHSRLAAQLYRNQTQLMRLVSHDAETQARICDLIAADEASDVLAAEEILNLRPKTPPRWERQYRSHKKRWKTLEQKARVALIRWLVETGQVEAAMGAPLPRPESEGYLSAAELAAMRLPGLPASKKGMLARALSSGWDSIEVPDRGGMTRLFRIADLPVDARRAVERRRAISDGRLGVQTSRQPNFGIETVVVMQDGSDGSDHSARDSGGV